MRSGANQMSANANGIYLWGSGVSHSTSFDRPVYDAEHEVLYQDIPGLVPTRASSGNVSPTNFVGVGTHQNGIFVQVLLGVEDSCTSTQG
jgi:hypothetical protein